MNALHRKAEDSPVHDTFTSVFRSLGDSSSVAPGLRELEHGPAEVDAARYMRTHPRLTSEQIRAALAYAAESLAFSVALAEDWDRKFEADIREGRLDGLAEEAIEDLSEGRCTDLSGQPESPFRDDTAEPT